ncbi:MAG: hypothetical protein LQ352_002114 [Teloschistes flavicans]|nr:MAG: hypothetical protein LQ352_002114 [Teloschistes flavicans]
MIARHAFRAAVPLQYGIRHYASQPPLAGGPRFSKWIKYPLYGLGGSFGLFLIADSMGLVTGREEVEPDLAKLRSIATGEYKPSKKTFTGGDQGWVDLKLESVEEINHNTKKFRFALPEENDVSGLTVASALLTKYKGPEMEKPVIRPYTPTSDEDEKGHIDLIVKRYPNGPMSEHIHNMSPPQRLDFKGPIPKYAWTPNKHRHICLIAGGTGITPMYQLCRAIFSNPSDTTKVTLVFGNVSEDDILLKHEFEELENTYPQRFRAFYMLDKPNAKEWPTQSTGHINQELLKTVLPEPKEEGVKVFVCGPPGMYKAISGGKNSPSDQGELSGILKEMGYDKEQVYKF